MGRQQVAGTQQGAAVVADAGAPARAGRFSSSDSPEIQTKQLNQLRSDLAEVQKGATGRNSQSIVYPDLPTTVAGLLPIQHGLGRRARWRVVDWVPTLDGTACNVVRNSSDNALQTPNTLALRAYSAGVVSIEVF